MLRIATIDAYNKNPIPILWDFIICAIYKCISDLVA